jgi:heterodisulfide reductase subunit A-like polyferredoxin
MFKQNLRFRIDDDAMFTRLDDETIIYNNKTSYYYTLNEVGSEIFKLISDDLAFGEIVKTIYDNHKTDISIDVVKNDVFEILNDLLSEKIIVKVDDHSK